MIRCVRFTRVLFSKRHFSQNIVLEDNGNGIKILSLSREKGKNAFSRDMLNDFVKAINDAKNDKNAKVLIIKSNVEKVFCAGADLKERLEMPADQVSGFVSKLRESFELLAKVPFPTIAAIEGVAFGGGLELALACDLRVLGERSILSLPETALAIIPGAGGTQRLSRIVGLAKAKEMIYTGSQIKPKEAIEIGLANFHVEHGKAFEKSIEIAEKISSKGPVGIRMAKKSIDGGYSLSIEEGLKVEKECYDQVIYTSDRLEGLKAFVEKRAPQYKGE